MPAFESERETIGTYHSDHIGEELREGLTDLFPAAPLEVVPVQREGHAMFDLFVKTDPITVGEMRAFVQGYFTAYNKRH